MSGYFAGFKKLFKRSLYAGSVAFVAYPFVFTDTKFYYKETSFNNQLLNRCSMYLSNYRPLPLFDAGVRQILFNYYFCEDRAIPIEYERHTLTMKDGGTIALDWATPEENSEATWYPAMKQKKRRVCLIVPGISGG